MDFKAALTGAVAGAVIAIGASYFLFAQQQSVFDDLKKSNPPVVVVDFAKIVSQYPAGATEDETNALMARTNNAIVKLRDAGYLVLDAQAVLSAPTDVYLPTNVISAE